MDLTINTANNIALARLISNYLSLSKDDTILTLEDACITSKEIPKRFGVMADATAIRYKIQHLHPAWSLSARAVWRNGKLMAPIATHTVIEDYYNDGDGDIGEDAIALLVNDWLRSF